MTQKFEIPSKSVALATVVPVGPVGSTTPDVNEPIRAYSPQLELQRVVGTDEAAAFLNFSVPHFRRLYRAGVVPAPIQLSARKLGWRLGDLINWIAARQNGPTSA